MQEVGRVALVAEHAEGHRRACAGLQPVEAGAQGDAAHPRAELLRVAEGSECAKATQQRLLGEVVGNVATAHLAVAERGDAPGPAAHEFFVRLVPTLQGLADQFAVRRQDRPSGAVALPWPVAATPY